jgi:hypothetical protein
MKHTLLYVCMLIACAVSYTGLHAQTILPDEDAQELFLSFRYQGVINTYIPGYYYDGSVYLSVNALFDALRIQYAVDDTTGTVSGFFIRPSNRYEIRFRINEAVTGGRTIPLHWSDFLIVYDEYYVHPRLLRELFDLTFTVHLGSLTLTLFADESLPVVQAHRRMLHRMHAPRADMLPPHAPLIYTRERSWMNGGVLDYELSATQLFTGEQYYSSSITAGGEVAGGDARIMYRGSASPHNASSNSFRAQWRYVFDSWDGSGFDRYLSQVQVGDIFTSGLNRYSLYGVALTNQPLEPRRQYRSYRYSGTTHPEWEVDLYINNRLFDSAIADAYGNFAFDIPLIYGSSLIEVRGFGPSGESSEEKRRIEIPYTLLPKGETIYELQAGKYYYTHTSAAQVNISRGFTSRITGTMGYEYSDLPVYRQSFVYGAVSAMPTLHTFFNAEAAPKLHYRVSADQVVNLSSRIGGSAVYYAPDSPQFRAGMERQYDVRGGFPVAILRTPVYVRTTGSYIGYANGRGRRFTVDMSTNVAGVSALAGIRLNRTERFSMIRNTTLVRFGAAYRTPRQAGTYGGILIRARVEADIATGHTENYSIAISRNISRTGRFEMDYQRNAFLGTDMFSVHLRFDLAGARTVTAVRQAPHHASFSQRVHGSVAYDKSAARFVAYNRGWVGGAGATLRMFIDRNGNGRHDPGEPLVETVPVRFRQTAVQRIHGDGIVRARELLPYVRYSIDISENSMPNPLWVPRYSSFSFVADPNQFKNIDIPLTVTGEVEGRVVRAAPSGTQGIGGIRIHIVGMDTGARWETRTFSDGAFYTMGLPPGVYEISPDADQLKALQLLPDEAVKRIEIRSSEHGDFVDGIEFRVSADRTAAP